MSVLVSATEAFSGINLSLRNAAGSVDVSSAVKAHGQRTATNNKSANKPVGGFYGDIEYCTPLDSALLLDDLSRAKLAPLPAAFCDRIEPTALTQEVKEYVWGDDVRAAVATALQRSNGSAAGGPNAATEMQAIDPSLAHLPKALLAKKMKQLQKQKQQVNGGAANVAAKSAAADLTGPPLLALTHTRPDRLITSSSDRWSAAFGEDFPHETSIYKRFAAKPVAILTVSAEDEFAAVSAGGNTALAQQLAAADRTSAGTAVRVVDLFVDAANPNATIATLATLLMASSTSQCPMTLLLVRGLGAALQGTSPHVRLTADIILNMVATNARNQARNTNGGLRVAFVTHASPVGTLADRLALYFSDRFLLDCGRVSVASEPLEKATMEALRALPRRDPDDSELADGNGANLFGVPRGAWELVNCGASRDARLAAMTDRVLAVHEAVQNMDDDDDEDVAEDEDDDSEPAIKVVVLLAESGEHAAALTKSISDRYTAEPIQLATPLPRGVCGDGFTAPECFSHVPLFVIATESQLSSLYTNGGCLLDSATTGAASTSLFGVMDCRAVPDAWALARWSRLLGNNAKKPVRFVSAFANYLPIVAPTLCGPRSANATLPAASVTATAELLLTIGRFTAPNAAGLLAKLGSATGSAPAFALNEDLRFTQFSSAMDAQSSDASRSQRLAALLRAAGASDQARLAAAQNRAPASPASDGVVDAALHYLRATGAISIEALSVAMNGVAFRLAPQGRFFARSVAPIPVAQDLVELLQGPAQSSSSITLNRNSAALQTPIVPLLLAFCATAVNPALVDGRAPTFPQAVSEVLWEDTLAAAIGDLAVVGGAFAESSDAEPQWSVNGKLALRKSWNEAADPAANNKKNGNSGSSFGSISTLVDAAASMAAVSSSSGASDETAIQTELTTSVRFVAALAAAPLMFVAPQSNFYSKLQQQLGTFAGCKLPKTLGRGALLFSCADGLRQRVQKQAAASTSSQRNTMANASHKCRGYLDYAPLSAMLANLSDESRRVVFDAFEAAEEGDTNEPTTGPSGEELVKQQLENAEQLKKDVAVAKAAKKEADGGLGTTTYNPGDQRIPTKQHPKIRDFCEIHVHPPIDAEDDTPSDAVVVVPVEMSEALIGVASAVHACRRNTAVLLEAAHCAAQAAPSSSTTSSSLKKGTLVSIPIEVIRSDFVRTTLASTEESNEAAAEPAMRWMDENAHRLADSDAAQLDHASRLAPQLAYFCRPQTSKDGSTFEVGGEVYRKRSRRDAPEATFSGVRPGPDEGVIEKMIKMCVDQEVAKDASKMQRLLSKDGGKAFPFLRSTHKYHAYFLFLSKQGGGN